MIGETDLKPLKASVLFESLKSIADPRIERHKRHSLIDILVIALCASVCGAEGWEDIEEFGKSKFEWFARFLELENGIPSHDTFRRVFIRLSAQAVKESYLQWISAAVKISAGQLVNIDGKKLRGSRNTAAGKEALSIVSAWAGEQSLVLGQVKCAEKSNEIRAIPELLKVLELSGAIVTIDAMGCQKTIVSEIASKSADYVISLKGNQGNLHTAVREYLDCIERGGLPEVSFDYCSTLEKGHGRIERRRCWATEEIGWLAEREEWKNLTSIIMLESEREVTGSGKNTIERRYFISSLKANAAEALRAVRGHWAIENELHWCLDIAFREDECRVRDTNAAENLATVRHLALNLLKQEKTSKRSIKGKRLKAGWDEDYLHKVLNF